MNMKEHILAAMHEQLDRWEELLGSLSPEQLAIPLAPSPWSTKDVIAHLWAWQQRTNARLEAAAHNGEPVFPKWPADLDPNGESDTDRINEWIYQTYRNLSWSEVHQAWKAGYLHLLNLAEAVAEKDLMDDSHYTWMQGYPLVLILLSTYDHHQEHYEKLLAWLRQHGGDIRP